MPYDHSFQAKIMSALQQGLAQTLGPVYSGRVYSVTAPPTATFPLLIYQQQDIFGQRTDFLDQNGWTGFMAFRSIDTTQSGAMNKLLSAVQALQGLTTMSGGYSVQITLRTPQQFPIERSSAQTYYTAAVLADVEIYN